MGQGGLHPGSLAGGSRPWTERHGQAEAVAQLLTRFALEVDWPGIHQHQPAARVATEAVGKCQEHLAADGRHRGYEVMQPDRLVIGVQLKVVLRPGRSAERQPQRSLRQRLQPSIAAGD